MCLYYKVLCITFSMSNQQKKRCKASNLSGNIIFYSDNLYSIILRQQIKERVLFRKKEIHQLPPDYFTTGHWSNNNTTNDQQNIRKNKSLKLLKQEPCSKYYFLKTHQMMVIADILKMCMILLIACGTYSHKHLQLFRGCTCFSISSESKHGIIQKIQKSMTQYQIQQQAATIVSAQQLLRNLFFLIYELI